MDPETPSKPVIPPPDLPKVVVPPTPPISMEVPPPPVVSDEIRVNVRVSDAPDVDEDGEVRAAFNPRFIAGMIDLLVAIGIQMTAWFILPGFLDRVAWVLAFGYLVTRDSLPFLGGRSIGKSAMGLRALTLDGKPLTGMWEKALYRNGAFFVPVFFIVEAIVLLMREDKPEQGRRLGDEWAKTKVIVVKPPVEDV